MEGFEIERSINGTTYTRIGSVPAKTSQASYLYADEFSTLSPGIFYRLAMADKNGKDTYSHVLYFGYGGDAAGGLIISPNPVAVQSSLSFNSTRNGSAEIQLLNAGGGMVSRRQVDVVQGVNVYSFIKPSGLTPGVYCLRLVSGGVIKATMLVIQ